MTPALASFLQPLLALAGIGVSLGALLGHAARRYRIETDPVVERINDLLPQTQCGQCGHPGCRPYAVAIAAGEAINKCPPGGSRTITALAALLNVRELPLDETHGTTEPRRVAFIREAECIGCAKCIPACPVDAILGAPKFMHTVIVDECTGCDLCVDPCPVDCIDMVTVNEDVQPVDLPQATAGFNACINCGLCIDECPVAILPHTLYQACRTGDMPGADRARLMHCIECGKCDTACPPGIPLTETFQLAKQQRLWEMSDKVRAENARQRFEAHTIRYRRLADAEEERRRRRAELAGADNSAQPADKIQAALARARAKRNES